MTQRIFSRTSHLVGRDACLERLVRLGASGGGLVLLAEPGAGASEILRHLCDRLLLERSDIIPFYFEVGRNGLDKMPAWPDRGNRSLVIIDAAQNADPEMLRALAESYDRAGISFIVAGWRRSLFGVLPNEAMRLERLSVPDTASVVENISRSTDVAINDATRDLIALVTGRRPRMIEAIFATAAEQGRALDSFRAVQQVFTDEIFGGRIGREMDTAFSMVVDENDTRQKLIALLFERAVFPIVELHRIGLDEAEIRRLHALEFINIDRGVVRVNSDDHVLANYLQVNSNLNEPRGLSVGKMAAANVASAPLLMAEHYRGEASLDLRGMLSRLDGQTVARVAIDHSLFKATLKGADEAAIETAFASGAEPVDLPRVVYTVRTTDIYPAIREFIDKQRSAVAISSESNGKQIALIAAEIESKLEANAELTTFWCDRLEMVAAASGFDNYRIWLIAPEGFDADASETLTMRGAYGSSRNQFMRLMRLLATEPETPQSHDAEKHELTVPMGESGERLAARFVEDIAGRHGIRPTTSDQIKTALIEACINAAEHSLSPDQVIKLKFAVEPERMTITVGNRGIRLSDKVSPVDNSQGRRGWGLKLIRSLMDDVRIENTDDGTELVMAKDLTGLEHAVH